MGDLVGGFGAAMVVLPQAMAYGVALFTLMGMSPSGGALAGLIGAACLSLVSGIGGGTIGLVSAPTGPALALLTGAVLSFQALGLAGPQLYSALLATIVLAGGLQIAIAASGGGRLIRFIPYPVVIGFTTGAALLMIQSQLKPVFGPLFDGELRYWHAIPLLTAVATYWLIYASAKWMPKVPMMLTGLLGGALVYHGLAAAAAQPLPARWVIGALPEPALPESSLLTAGFAGLPVGAVLSAALALAMLSSINTLLASVIADLNTGNRHNARRELVAQGVAQTVTGLLGGIGGSGTTGATVVAVSAGARRWAGAAAGAVFVLLLLFAGPAGKLLPVAVLGGIVIYVAVHMISSDALEWLRSRRTRLDAAVACFVTVITVTYDLVTAVGAGVVITIIRFIRSQVRMSVVHRRSTRRRSVRRRTAEEQGLLEQHADRIVIYELRGNLFFATVDSLFEELLPDLDRPAWVILHLRRVSQIDLTGIKILHQIATRLHAHGGHLLCCEVHSEIGLGSDVDESVTRVAGKFTGARKVLTFVGSDEALEFAENALLAELGHAPTDACGSVELADRDLCAEMTPAQIESLRSVVSPLTVAAGCRLFAAGDRGDCVYLVTSGEVEVRLQTTQHHYKRLACYGPGTCFGEIAFLDPGPRTADAIVVRRAELLVLDRAGLERLRRESPETAVALLVALGRMQGDHLRSADLEVQHLAQV